MIRTLQDADRAESGTFVPIERPRLVVHLPVSAKLSQAVNRMWMTPLQGPAVQRPRTEVPCEAQAARRLARTTNS
jgi:hypothetical protein